MDSKGYYKTLGVPENASDDEIKKAYKKLCIKWHPDKWVNGTDEEKKTAEEEFKKVGEAYAVLSDKDKKAQYDSGFEGGFDENNGGFDPFDWIRERGGFGNFFHERGNQRNAGHQGSDINVNIKISFTESLKGTNKDIKVKKSVACPDCNGTGSADGQNHECPHCHGTGMETITQRTGNTIFTQSRPCPHCHGTGKIATTPCSHCNGTGQVQHEDTINIQIPSNVRDGITISYAGLGNEGTPGFPNGNLNVTIKVEAEMPGYFKVSPNSNDVLHEETVDFVDALLGKKITVKCPDGSDWQINLHECTQPGEKYTKSGAGYKPNGQWGPQTTGNYLVKINYNVPTKLTKKQKKILEDFKNEK